MKSEALHSPSRPSAIEQMQRVVRPFEQLDSAEEMRAASQFNKLVQEMLFHFAGDVQVDDHDLREDRVEADLLLDTPRDKTGSHITIGVRSSLLDSGEQLREISIQYIDKGYFGRDYHRYLMEDSDCVRRDDAGDLYEKINNPLNRCKENQKPEQAMDMNKQPVGTEEIAALRELFEAAKPVGY